MTTRRFRSLIALFALLGVLSTQLALAGYLCPNTWANQHISELEQLMPDCGGDLDLEQPGLCKAHAEYGKQSLDKPVMPPVAPFAATVLLFALQSTGPPPGLSSVASPVLARASPPSLAISHCCLRI